MEKIIDEMIEEYGWYTPLKALPNLPISTQLEMYYRMWLIREFDTRVRELWMANKIYGLAHSYVGAEAIAVGACFALKPEDVITSTHRGHGHTIAKGGDVKKMMAELFGKYEGYNHGKGGSMHIADVEHGMLGATGIVGSGIPIAVGSAYASDLLGNKWVTLCFHGDGATNQGVWHESINMAAVWNLPVVFLIENNQIAIATDLCCASKETNLYKRALSYGIPGVLVDGFNPFAVYDAVKTAVELARTGQGPSLIEARFVRLVGHFVADDQWYRDLKKLQKYWAFDPLIRMQKYFTENKLVDERTLEELKVKAKNEVEAACYYAEQECTEPSLETLYMDLYANGEIIK